MIIAVVIAVVLAIGGGAALLYLSPWDDDSSSTNTADSDSDSDNSDNSDDDDDTDTDDNDNEPSYGSPTETVEAYYAAMESHDMDAALDTVCQAQYDASADDPYDGDNPEDFWAFVDDSEYNISSETEIDDTTYHVEVEHSFDHQGQTGSGILTAEVIAEDDEWKICDWQVSE